MLGLIFGWWLFIIGAFAQIVGVVGILFQYEGRTAE